ncbi:glycosyltransferase family 2 protein [Devosia sp.]|uniref:glycosyltransferase family 2 protein n=1 Tax=Devosia sp. TaxID=1871048 RepID=UPI003A93B2BD
MHLELAAGLRVDPLDYCAHRFGLTEAQVLEHAADWCGLVFATHIPTTRDGSPLVDRIERLGETRMVRARLFDREIVYSAPRFADLLQFADHVRRHPEFRRQICLVPLGAIQSELARASATELLDASRQRLVRRWPQATGGIDAPYAARRGFVIGLVALLCFATIAPWVATPLYLPVAAALLLMPALLRLWAALRPEPRDRPPPRLTDAQLPVYSLLVPLHDEARVVPQLVAALRAIDYPPEKLDVHFVVEAASVATVAAVAAELHDPRFSMVLVPDALPRTKPKALNFALPLIRGTYVAVYDAEDIPDPPQLRLAASRFAQHPEIACLQAELVLDNADENSLTALFAGEYAGQFGLLLPLLADLDLPMPLGGTSNHLRVSALRRIGGWDPFNVTEDADLGVRLARLGLKTATLASQTGEEAPIGLRAWLHQRTRWIKGWMQTLIVHNRHPQALLRDLGWWRFIGFELYVGSMVLSAPLHSLFALSLGLAAALGAWRNPQFWDWTTIAILTIGYAAPLVLTFAGLRRLKRRDLWRAQLLLPAYWVLHSLAAILAVRELLARPHFWAKTAHGRTRQTRSLAADSSGQAE